MQVYLLPPFNTDSVKSSKKLHKSSKSHQHHFSPFKTAQPLSGLVKSNGRQYRISQPRIVTVKKKFVVSKQIDR